MREFVERLKADKRRRHAQVLEAIRLAPVAIAMTGRGRVTLAVVTPEMSRPSEGAWRASIYWDDGPAGHITRKTLDAIASELADTYSPERIRQVDDAEVIAWTSTDKFSEGVRQASEAQAWNEKQRG